MSSLSGGRVVMARRDLIDEYLIQVNKWFHERGGKKLSGFAEVIEMIDEKDRQVKEFNERLIHAQRPTRSLY